MKAVSRIVIQEHENSITIQLLDTNGQVLRDTIEDERIVVFYSNLYVVETLMIGTFSRLGAEIKLQDKKESKVVFDLQWPDKDREELLNMQIEHLSDYGNGMRKNAVKVLKQNGIETIFDLSERTIDDLLALQGFGNASLHDLLSTLTDLGLRSSDSRFRIQRKVIDL